jgi:hypothetical protein
LYSIQLYHEEKVFIPRGNPPGRVRLQLNPFHKVATIKIFSGTLFKGAEGYVDVMFFYTKDDFEGKGPTYVLSDAEV